MHIPIRLGLLGANGHDLGLKLAGGEELPDGVVSLTKRRQSFRFIDVPSRPVPSLLRGFSAPVNVTLDLPDDDAELLMANDSDLFNRWQAANSYASRTLVEAVSALASGKKSDRGLRYARALGAALGGDGLEPAYRAELLKLPTQADVARIIGKNVDPALVHRAHRALMKLIGKTLGRPARRPLCRNGRDRPVLARRGERRPPRLAQRRPDAADHARHARRHRPSHQALLPMPAT